MTSFGIDLGTTNSVIAQLVDGVPRAIPVDGDPIVPSTVLYAPDGRVVVGREARNLALLHPDRAVRSVKRRMGQPESIRLGDRDVTPEQVSAEILRTLAAAAAAETGEQVRDVVITVPAYFNDAQRRATLAAGELAGLHVLRLLNEPTAASLVYEHVGAEAADSSELMLVYDLGGGTFDVSVLEVFEDVREVRATTGDTQLGGDDFDAALVERLLDELREHDVDELDAAGMARLARAAETAKINLSSALEVEVHEEFIASVDGEPVHLRCTITRREFESLITTLLTNTVELARRAIDDAALRPDERIARICLVGGSTRIPLVRSLLADAFESDVHEEIDVDLAVGLGATIQAGMLSGQECGRVLVDVASHTLGLRVFGEDDDLRLDGEPDSFAPLLRRNTALPAERTEEFYTMVHDQEGVRVDIFQGEGRRCSDNVPVGGFDFELEPAPAQTPVRFRIAYDLDGIVRVTASQASGREKTVALELPDASRDTGSRPGQPSAASEAEPPSAVLRRANRLLATVEGRAHARLHELIDAWHASGPARRSEIEDELLDLFLEIEAEG
jgi:molecular chaperone DnaK